MKAIQIEKYGPNNDVLKVNEISSPILQPGQILVKTKAFGVNPFDWKLRTGMFSEFYPLPLPYTLGFEASGIVLKVADDITNFKVGDKVYGRAIHAFAEEIVFDVNYTYHIPNFLSFEEAAALPGSSQTAFNALITVGKLKKDQKVFIHAGSGGVGISSIQIAKYYGAHITTTVSDKNIDFVKNLGADIVIDYKKTDLTEITDKFDIVLDTIGGETQIKSWPLVKDTGILVSLLGDESSKFGNILPEQKFIFAEEISENRSSYVNDLILNHHIKPIIDEVFSFENIKQALEKSETGRAVGKIIVRI